jgi:hypothetical protein
MGDVFLYADETGNLDYGGAGKRGATTYFGFGTAVFYGDHGRQLMEGLRLRVQVTAAGVSLTRGFHAVDDSRQTRDAMYTLIGNQAPRFDTTFLLKSAVRGPSKFGQLKSDDSYAAEAAFFQSCSAWSGVR